MTLLQTLTICTLIFTTHLKKAPRENGYDLMRVTTKYQKSQKFLNDGDIRERQHSQVFKAAEACFKDSLSYNLTKFPLLNKLIIKAGWIDVQRRIDSKWESMEFFINRFKAIFQQLPLDKKTL